MRSSSVQLLITAVTLAMANPEISASQVATTVIPLSSAESFTRNGAQSWAAGGAGIAVEGLPTAATSNPACLFRNGITLYAEAGKRLPADWGYDITYDNQWIAPGYISLSVPVESWTFGVGYANYFDFQLSMEPVPITTEAAPDGTGQFFEFERTARTLAFFGSARYQMMENASVGITGGLTRVSATDQLGNVSANGSGYGFLVIAGGRIGLESGLALGAAISAASTVDMKARYANSQQLTPIDPRDSLQNAALPGEYSFRTGFPWIAQAGFSWTISPQLDLMGTLEYQHWSQISDEYGNLWQVHLGAAIATEPGLIIRLGIFTQSDPVGANQRYLNQIFLTAGLEHQLSEHVALSGSLLDSHLFSTSGAVPGFSDPPDKFRQTYLALGGAYTF